MAYKYQAPDPVPARETRKGILDDLKRWREQRADPAAVGAVDFPVPAKIGGAEAICRFELGGIPVEFKTAIYDNYEVNFVCVRLAIKAMRLNEARGIGETMRDAYLMLNAPAKHRDPWEILGARSDADWEDIEDLYKLKARRLHPDTAKDGSGDPAEMAALNVAFEAIKKERNV